MDYILCKKCETGNPGYLSVCGSCGADLFGEDNVDEGPPIGSEISDEKLRRNAVIAVVIWVATTAFKVWFLYSLAASSHVNFPQLRDLFILLWPVATSAVAATKYRRWYLALYVDSIIMIVIFLIFFAILIAAKLKG
jgi:hypothetical protein